MNHVPYESIEQFRHVCKQVKLNSEYIGKDDNGDPVYDETLPKPIIRFNGTVKLHGTNVSVCVQHGEIWYQSRECIITPQKDCMGFAKFAEARESVFRELCNKFCFSSTALITIFGEWVGKGIQSGTAINNLDKSFFIFGAKVAYTNRVGNFTDSVETWLDITDIKSPENNIYNIEDYTKFSIGIDFNNPEASTEDLAKMVEYVEAQCPVGKAFGFEGIGEGIVFVGYNLDNKYMFKAKGLKHQVSKTKELVSVDSEKLASVEQFIAYAFTDIRYEQAVSKVCTSTPEPKDIGNIIKWVLNDIVTEEKDVLLASSLDVKDIQPLISKEVRSKILTL